jgi:hypothetical protein
MILIKANTLISIYMGNGMIDKGKLLRVMSVGDDIHATFSIKAKDSQFYHKDHEITFSILKEKHGGKFWMHSERKGMREWINNKKSLYVPVKTLITNPLIICIKNLIFYQHQTLCVDWIGIRIPVTYISHAVILAMVVANLENSFE